MSSDDLRQQVLEMMDAQWVAAHGYTAPNTSVYPWQWLWDSCFHVVIWAALGMPDRAVAELEAVLLNQDALGFVPHMNYQLDPAASVEFWGRSGSSCITQPPMFGHALAELVRRDVEISPDLFNRCALGLEFLVEHRRRSSDGLVMLCHPWETGTDDSPRWDDACPGGFDIERWRAHKSHLVSTVELASGGSAIANPEFQVSSAGFNALIAFNVAELLSVAEQVKPSASREVVDLESLAAKAAAIVAAVDDRWNGETWIDGGVDSPTSRSARTADGLLPLLVSTNEQAVESGFGSLVDPLAYGGAYGPAGVHRGEPTYEPNTYWRGPAWPQLSYLLWIAAKQEGALCAPALAKSLRDGAATSGLAEYWNIDSGAGLGAMPQSWAGLGILAE